MEERVFRGKDGKNEKKKIGKMLLVFRFLGIFKS